MACVCRSCLDHSRTLGVGQALLTRHAIHRAYRVAAKRWHPDRFRPDDPARLEAEEGFKRIHAAYQALCEHLESPHRRPREAEFVTPIRTTAPPTIFFGDAPGCYSAPDFPPAVEACIVATRPETSESPVAFIDLAPGREPVLQYVLLTNHRMYVRDHTLLVSVIWYDDLGQIRLIDPEARKPGFWQRIAEQLSGKGPRYVLEIDRQNGQRFYTLDEGPDDRVKKVIYNFLLQMKSKSQA